MKLQAVTNRKLYIQIADQIRDQISSGAVQPGQQLPSERDLALELGVSRPTVREALIALEVAGLVEIRVGVGAFVAGKAERAAELPEQNHSPLEIMNARQLIEPEIVALAARLIGVEDRAKLLEMYKTMQDETESGRWSPTTDQKLHMAIADACQNSVLRELLQSLWRSRSEKMDLQLHAHLGELATIRDHILTDHGRIVSAIVENKPSQARKAMIEHLRYVEKAMHSIWD